MHTAIAICVAIFCLVETPSASPQDVREVVTPDLPPERPKILSDQRWAEDWSVLADSRVQQEPLDHLKYIPLSSRDPKTYLSLGLNLRERFESDHTQLFGFPPAKKGEWILSRLEWHADLRVGKHVQVFAQLQNAFAPGKPVLFDVDQNRLDVEQAFIGITESTAGGTLKVQLGRQLVPVGFERFVSVRDGPNLRQPFDAAYADYGRGAWHISTAYTQPVKTQDRHPFSDYSSTNLTFSGVRFLRRVRTGEAAAYYAYYKNDDAVIAGIHGTERRKVVDVRWTGTAAGFDWDLEAMNQTGRFRTQAIEAKAIGSVVGYTFAKMGWSPRTGFSVDIATGDHNAHDNTLETFNPLFPNGYYLADYTGYPNLIHIKPSLTIHPRESVNLMLAIAGQWRETTADAIYAFPSFALPNTRGTSSRYTGIYTESRGNWTITPHYSITFDAVHYTIGPVIRSAGGRDAAYLGLQWSYAW